MLLRRLVVVALLLAGFANALFAQTPAPTVKSPDEFLPHRLGEQFTPHHLLTDYFEYLATQCPQTLRLERYGTTNEGRPLQVALISSPENLARLEEIRLNNLRLSGLGDGKTGKVDNAPAIVWLSMSVHGNEAAGSECSHLLAWQLATQTEASVREWLKNVVVILDPSTNPDGYDRYTHWYREVANVRKNVHPDSREHREPWITGRTNHYVFDLNRDWAWATQVETRQRLALYQRWLPQVVADLHEQGYNSPYYFAPAAEPMHAYITPWQRDFQTQIGENHARYFDQNGWLYFTKEVFDLLYPSYGDTYPSFNGAIGMTYEQAGIGAGRAIRTEVLDTLTLHDRILHHLTTSRSTLEMASQHARKLLENFRDYHSKAVTNPPGQYPAFVIRADNDPNQVHTLCQMLDRHQIRYGRAGTAYNGVRAFDYKAGKETTVAVQPNDLVISTFQPHGVMVEVLFEPHTTLTDSLTYDITSWAMPFAYGLDAYAVKQRIEPRKAYQAPLATEIVIAAQPYAWCVHRRSLAEAQWLAELLDKGVNVRYGHEAFALVDQQFEPGSLVIVRADNRSIEGQLDGWVKAAAARYNVALHPILSGFSGKGPDLGSSHFTPIKRPNVALVYGESVDDNSFGHTWYFFEQELGYPVTPVALDRLQRARLQEFNVLIFPNGNYNLDETTLTALKEWVRKGGRVVGFEGGAKAFADKDGLDCKTRTSTARKDSTGAHQPYQLSERMAISEQLPGAVVKARVDTTHPLGYGLGDAYFSLKTHPDVYEMPEGDASKALWLEEQFDSYGFIGSRVKARLPNSPLATLQSIGQGSVVLLADNPLYRCFWQQGKVLFANALFF